MSFHKFLRALFICAIFLTGSFAIEAECLYVIGNLAVSDGVWNPTKGAELTSDGTCYSGLVDIQPYGTDSHGYFAVVASLTADANDWSATRYGADENDFDVTLNKSMKLNSNSNSWKVQGGSYSFRVNLDQNTITVSTLPATIYVMGNIDGSDWSTSVGVPMTRDGAVYTAGDVRITPMTERAETGKFNLATTIGDDWDAVNAADRFGPVSATDIDAGAANAVKRYLAGVDSPLCSSWIVPVGVYDITFNLNSMTMTFVRKADPDPDPEPNPNPDPEPAPDDYPDDLFVIGNLAVSSGGWDVRRPVCLVRDGSRYSGTVEFQGYNGEATSYFTLVTKLGYYAGDDWATVGTGTRYGAPGNNTPASPSSQVVKNSTEAWTIPSGTYKITVDLADGTLTVSAPDAPHGSGMTGGWPEGYDGVMLQSFYWDCFNDGWGWEWLSSRSDEICDYFDVMWIPNFAFCDDPGAGGMGYHPINWFTNFSSAFGSEQQFRDMLGTYKAKGMDMMAEVVINHRYGFPTETWNGQSWHIGTDCIPNNDQPTPGSGNPDTGIDWGLCADLDHTNTNVQANVKAYEDLLVKDLGFAGFRYDFVIGYAPEFIKIYNRHSGPVYSVGEYWDENRAVVASWINGTAYQSAAFDFPGKFAISSAFHDNDMTKLVDATLADYGYGRYSVPFIDNHDTFNEDANRFAGTDDQIVAANAFILSMPGTPCVFIVHWNRFKDQIKPLIEARKQAGITNTSTVNLLRSNKDCFMAEVNGTKGKLAVKVGPELSSPDGYKDSDIVTSGNQYCVWLKKDSADDPGNDVEMPEKLYVVGNLQDADWSTSASPAMEKDGNTFRNSSPVKFSSDQAYFSFITTLGDTWDDVNKSSRIAPSLDEDAPITLDTPVPFNIYTPDMNVAESKAWKIQLPDGNVGEYNLAVDFATKQVTISRNNVHTALNTVTADSGEVVYFNLFGQRVENPGPGLYIRLDGNRPSKVMIK